MTHSQNRPRGTSFNLAFGDQIEKVFFDGVGPTSKNSIANDGMSAGKLDGTQI
jgi:hypothetical protein